VSNDDPAVKPPKVKRTRKSRALVDAKNYTVRLDDSKQRASIDYITDPERRPAKYHYNRADRNYSSLVTFTAFSEWSRDDKWSVRREQFWNEIEARVMKEWGDRLFHQKLAEIGQLTLSQDSMIEYLTPLQNRDGSIKRHGPLEDDGSPNPYQGLPVFPMKLPTADKLAKMVVEIAKVIMVKRGETTSRTEQVTSETTGETRRVTALDPVGAKVSFSKDDIRAMSRLLLMRRQPQLETSTIDIEEENGIPEDEW